jgi:surface protein
MNARWTRRLDLSHCVYTNPLTPTSNTQCITQSKWVSKVMLIRTDNDFEEAVKQWCDPSTREATLVARGHISDWITTKVTNCAKIFFGQQEFNDDISRWDMSNVTTMFAMFQDAKTFNKPIGDWNVSKVTTMEGMFDKAAAFNQPIGNWDVSNVTDMQAMFSRATVFNQELAAWGVTNVTSMRSMFQGAKAFNQAIGNWNVSATTNMYCVFEQTPAFNQDTSKWPSSARVSPPAPDPVKRKRGQGSAHNSEDTQTKKQRGCSSVGTPVKLEIKREKE